MFDDIVLTNKQQAQLNLLVKTYRHIRATIIFAGQDPLNSMSSQLRFIFNCIILGRGVNAQRLENNLYKMLKC